MTANLAVKEADSTVDSYLAVKGCPFHASGSIWEAFGGIWKVSGGIWEASGGIWEASGGIWEAWELPWGTPG